MAKKNTHQPKPPVKTDSPAQNAGFDWYIWLPLLMAFAVFSFGLRSEILGIDDHTATVDNPAVINFSPFGSFNLGMYAPITWLFYGIAYAVGKDNPFPYHFFSLAVHVFNVWLVNRLVVRISGQRAVGFWVALLFAIHPIQVESVSWIAGFSTPLYAMFFLLSCLWYLDYAEQPGQAKAYALALGSFVLACLSKSAAVTLPLVLVLLDWWARRSPLDRRRMLGYVPFFLAAAAFGALTIYSRNKAGINMDSTGNDFSLLDRFVVLCYTPVLYWGKILAPLNLNIYYSFDKVNGQFPWPYWVAPIVLAGVLYAAWRVRDKARYVWFGLLFFFANLSVMLPFRSMGTFELCADHYNYLAVVGIFFLLVQGLPALAERLPKWAGALRAVSGLWMAALVVLCALQVQIWKNTITVVTHAIDNGYNQNGRLFEARANALAQTLTKKRDKKDRDPMEDRQVLAAAINDYSRAIEINPELWDAYKFRGSLFGMIKKYERSAEDLGKYVEKNPNDHEQYFNLGLSLYNLGHFPESIKAFDRTLQLNPDFEQAYAARGRAYQAMGDSTKAAVDLKEFDNRKKK